MPDDKVEDILSGLRPSVKKELLDNIVKSLLNDMQEREKKELLQKLVSGGRKNRQVIDMVEH
ncbi:MAG: hypothetical protein GXP46_11280 [Deferribacteres bacterium]|nr:hypothetical protein [Deferribacteres bacterium]